MTYRPKGTKEMTYEEFRTIIKDELVKIPEGLGPKFVKGDLSYIRDGLQINGFVRWRRT